MHIHPSSPNSTSPVHLEEIAAIKIQAGFRGYRVRKQLNRSHSAANNGYHRKPRHHISAWNRRQQYLAMEGAQHQQQHSPNSVSSNGGSVSNASSQLGDNSRRNSADANSVEDRCATKIQAGIRGFLVRKRQKTAAEAATKIQASFRGFKARKEVQKLKQK